MYINLSLLTKKIIYLGVIAYYMHHITSNNGGKKSPDEEKKTTIQIYISTRVALSELGKKGETYDDILNRLIRFYKDHSK